MLRRLILPLFVMFFLAGAPRAAQAFPTTHPYPGIVYRHESRSNPPEQIYIARIDLANPSVQVRVSRGGPDPDGSGPWQTTLMRPTQIAEREAFDLVINGDFFRHQSGKDAEGLAALKEFRAGDPAAVIGPAETDGTVWALCGKSPRPALILDSTGHARIAAIKKPPPEAFQVIAGSTILVSHGRNVAPAPSSLFARVNPRTAVGIRDGGRTLILVVVDGRDPANSLGMSLKDLADVMLSLGAEDAINLDGGGSSTMAIRNPGTHALLTLNHPSDGTERPVADVLGIRITPPTAPNRPSTAASPPPKQQQPASQ